MEPHLVISQLRRIIGLFRFYNTRQMVVFYFVGVKLSQTPLFSWDVFGRVCLEFFSIYGFASLINYYFDLKIDRVNKKTNDLENLYWFNSHLMFLSVCLVILAFLFSTNFVITLILLLVCFCYSHPNFRWSYSPLTKLGSMLAIYAILPSLYGGFSHGGFADMGPLFYLWVMYGAIMLYSDVRDIKGDRQFGKITFAVLLGPKRLCIASFLISFAAFVGFLFFRPHVALISILGLVVVCQLGFAIWTEAIYSRVPKLFFGWVVLLALGMTVYFL